MHCMHYLLFGMQNNDRQIDGDPWRGALEDVDPGDLSALRGSYLVLSQQAAQSFDSMEGLWEVPAPKKVLSRGEIGKAAALILGLVGLAYALHFMPAAPFRLIENGVIRRPVGVALLAIVLGVLVGNLVHLPAYLTSCCRKVVQFLIPFAIVCIGAGLDFRLIGQAGLQALGVTLAAMALGYGAAFGAGLLFGLPRRTAALLGVGTSICGSSAIVAAAPLLDADEDDLVVSVATVNLMGLAAMVCMPAVGALLDMTSRQFGTWCGATIHAVPQVVAAADALATGGSNAVEWATMTKLTRVALLAPIMVMLAASKGRRDDIQGGQAGRRAGILRMIPWFVWGFLALALLRSVGALPSLVFEGASEGIKVAGLLRFVGKVLLVIALAAIGLTVNVRKLGAAGGKALLAGTVSTVILAAGVYLLLKGVC